MEKRTELRLRFDPDDLNRLQGLRRLRELSVGRAVTRTLNRTYFDTPDHQLHRQNSVLMVRSMGRRYVQCVRANGTQVDGIAINREWENPLPTPDPDPAAIADLDLRRLVMPLPGAPLEPVIRWSVKRTTRRLSPDATGDGTIAFALDVGEIVADGKNEPIAEIELSSDSDAAGVFDIALDIQKEIPLRLITEEREGYGFKLLKGEGPGWRKAIRLALSPATTVEGALSDILTHCMDHLIDNERCTLVSDHPEGVHQMRVAMRRMRSALRIFRAVLPPAQYLHVTDEVKWLTKSLADTRDLDVFMDEIVGPVEAAFADQPAFAVLREKLIADRAAARAEARTAVASERYTQFILETGAWMAGRGWRDQPVSEASAFLFKPITELSDALINKRFKKVRKEGRRFGEMTIDEKHQLRIDVKRLRYAIDFFSSLYEPKKVRNFIVRLQKLQDGLGYMNDLAVAGVLVEQIGNSAQGAKGASLRQAGALVMGWHGHACVEATKTLADDVAGLVAAKPFWSKPKKTDDAC
jgi:inorganic triphosphatase YgiF